MVLGSGDRFGEALSEAAAVKDEADGGFDEGRGVVGVGDLDDAGVAVFVGDFAGDEEGGESGLGDAVGDEGEGLDEAVAGNGDGGGGLLGEGGEGAVGEGEDALAGRALGEVVAEGFDGEVDGGRDVGDGPAAGEEGLGAAEASLAVGARNIVHVDSIMLFVCCLWVCAGSFLCVLGGVPFPQTDPVFPGPGGSYQGKKGNRLDVIHSGWITTWLYSYALIYSCASTLAYSHTYMPTYAYAHTPITRIAVKLLHNPILTHSYNENSTTRHCEIESLSQRRKKKRARELHPSLSFAD